MALIAFWGKKKKAGSGIVGAITETKASRAFSRDENAVWTVRPARGEFAGRFWHGALPRLRQHPPIALSACTDCSRDREALRITGSPSHARRLKNAVALVRASGLVSVRTACVEQPHGSQLGTTTTNIISASGKSTGRSRRASRQ